MNFEGYLKQNLGKEPCGTRATREPGNFVVKSQPISSSSISGVTPITSTCPSGINDYVTGPSAMLYSARGDPTYCQNTGSSPSESLYSSSYGSSAYCPSGSCALPLHMCNPLKVHVHVIEQLKDMITTNWPKPTPSAKSRFPAFCAKYEAIKAFNLPNALGARIQVESGLNVPNWISYLKDYHDNELCHFLAFGWPIGYYAPSTPVSVNSNHPSAQLHAQHVHDYISTEQSFNALTGPFSELPFAPWTRLSPLMTRPKKGSEARRIIVDLSFPEGQSVNTGIDITAYLGRDITYTLPSISDLIARLQCLGRGAWLWKADLARAYRQLRADPIDAPLLGIQFADSIYIDACPPFGCRSSSAACQRVANALAFLMARQSFHCLAYLDDFAGCEASPGVANKAFDKFMVLANELGLQLSKHKCVKPTKVIEWLGYLINTDTMTVAIPPQKLDEIQQECAVWLTRKKANKVMIQSLVGKLSHLSNCVLPGRKFLSRILSTLRDMGNRKWTTLNADFIKDVRWFFLYARSSNGITLYTPSFPQVVVECDSSLEGGGGNTQGYCYTWPYTTAYKEAFPVIHQMEAVNILVAYRTLAHRLSSDPRSVLILTDNMASSHALVSGRTKDSVLGACSRELWLEAARNGDKITVEHRPGEDIPFADALSRMHVDSKKLDYVRTVSARDEIVFVNPVLNDYCFFNPLL